MCVSVFFPQGRLQRSSASFWWRIDGAEHERLMDRGTSSQPAVVTLIHPSIHPSKKIISGNKTHKNSKTWLELLRHSVSVQTYSATSSWHFLLLTPCTSAVTGWAHCWVSTEVPKYIHNKKAEQPELSQGEPIGVTSTRQDEAVASSCFLAA